MPLSLILLIWITCGIGFVILWSAAGGKMYPWAQSQMLKFLIFFPVAVVIAVIDTKIIYKFAYIFYAMILLLLISVELFGSTAKGGTRWIDLGVIKLQPSEPAKLAIILMLSKYFHNLKSYEIGQKSKILVAIILTLIPITLIIKQPDLGTGLIALIVAANIFFIAGTKMWKFVVCGIATLITTPIIWHFMYEYQHKRVLVFLNPTLDPLGAGYNVIQSMIAIGSGGLVGKGLTNGTQSQLDFLPEHQTDFIFSSMAEETGFIGCIIVLLLYTLIISISMIISINCHNMFSKLMSMGISTMFFCHVFINIAMSMGIVPVVGVPLPFISYGGTMMASIMIGFGLIMNAHVHRFEKIKFNN